MNSKEILTTISTVLGEHIGPSLVTKVSDLNNRVLSLQGDNMALQADLRAAQNRIVALEKESNEAEHWNELEKRYPIQAIGNGVYARIGKNSANRNEPSHMLCADCFGLRQIKFLQQIKFRMNEGTTYRCNGCGFEVTI